jgi:hypothetical protein
MKIAPRRIRRIRDEMRLWLRSRHGFRAGYSQREIDRGREDLGFGSIEDTLIAYTLFGGDLMPELLDSLELGISADEIAAIVAVAPDGLFDPTDLLVED